MCEARYYFKIYLYACIASPRSLNVRTRSTSEITLLRIHFRLRAQNSELLKHVNHLLTLHQFESLPRAIFHIQFSLVSLMEFNFSATFNWRGWMRLDSCVRTPWNAFHIQFLSRRATIKLPHKTQNFINKQVCRGRLSHGNIEKFSMGSSCLRARWLSRARAIVVMLWRTEGSSRRQSLHVRTYQGKHNKLENKYRCLWCLIGTVFFGGTIKQALCAKQQLAHRIL